MNWKKYQSKKSLVVIFLAAFFIGSMVVKISSFKAVGKLIKTNYSVADPAFRETMGNLIGPAFLEGNRVETLVNGKEIFPAMLKAIREATNTITFEIYIWETGEIGEEFKKAFIERAAAGVKVKLIADGMGTVKLKNEDVEALEKGGVRFVKVGRDRWYKPRLNVNHRTHRKLMVVDGKIGFIGGVCIADKWMGDAQEPDHWRDTHFRVEGPAVRQMQGVIAQNWLLTTSELLQGPDYFPEFSLREGSASVVQCFKSGPKDGEENARLVHLLAIAAARKNIRLSHAYFVPDDLAVEQLLAARKRGVKIEIIVPFKNDSKVGKAAARSRWDMLADAGIEFFEYKQSLFHCKTMIVDDVFVTTGSINFDNRSFRINDEANINVLDKKFAATQIKIFEQDKSKSSALSAAMLRSRPWYSKVADYTAGLLRFLL
ncbi:MAG: phospholipase D-like domain-containing protein [Verrucomicrobiota bacterium]